MNIFTKIRSAGTFLKAAVIPSKLRFPGRASVFFDIKRATDSEMAKQVGNGTSSDVLMTPVVWLQNAMAEAPIVALDPKGNPIEGSELTKLLKTPNPFYSLTVLLAGTTLSLSIDGNAYWIVNHGQGGDKVPAEIWYAPHMNMEPKFPDDDATKFITHYEYTPKGQPQFLRPFGLDINDADAGVPSKVEEGLSVIHFRKGIDPDNLRKGLSSLKGLLREIWTDNEAASFTAALLRNMGIPGIMVSPTDNERTLTPKEAEAIEAKLDVKFSGEGRGKTLVALGPTKLEQFGFSPADLDLSALRNVSEERVTAALSVPAAVVGFGSGLEATKVGATMESMVRLGWSQGVIPLQKIITGEISLTLAPALGADSAEFDNKNVQALRENEDLKAARVGRLYRDGIFMRSEARSAMGKESVPADDVYISNLSTTFIPQGQTAPPSNGNGGGDPKALDGVYLWDEFTEETMRKTRAECSDCEPEAPCAEHAYKGGIVAGGWLRRSGFWDFKDAPPAEQRIIAAAPSADPLPIAQRMADELNVIRLRAPEILQARLERAFGEFGDAVELAARRVLDDFEMVADSGEREEKTLERLKTLSQYWAERKRDELLPDDIALAADLFTEIDIEAAKRAVQEAFEQGFLEVAIEVSGTVESTFGIEFVLDDAAQQRVLQNAGLRSGLIDLDAQTRDALFDALAEGRAEGLAGDNLARKIREHIEAGPWRDVETRARVIARTEGAHAANVSTLEAARAMPDTEHVQIFDDRLGDGDAQCFNANHRIITIQEAEAIGMCHPNGTRAFVPINAVLLEEMGL